MPPTLPLLLLLLATPSSAFLQRLSPVRWRGALQASRESSSVAPSLTVPVTTSASTAVVWYTTCDLRVHDHEALVAATSAKAVVPLFVFDPAETIGRAPQALRLVLQAVADLKRSLKARGSDLVIRRGPAGEHVAELAKRAGATAVYHHASPVAALRHQHAAVKLALEGTGVDLYTWRVILRGAAASKIAAQEAWDYKDYAAARLPQPWRDPFPAPESLPPLPPGLEAGDLPSAEALIEEAMAPLPPQVQVLLREAGGVEAAFGARTVKDAGAAGETAALKLLGGYVMEGELPFGQRFFAAEAETAFGAPLVGEHDDDGEEHLGLDAAATARIVRALGVAGLAPGEVFVRAFSPALSLGALSGRRVAAARRPGYAPNPLTVQRPLKCWGTALAEAAEWHDALAERDVTVCDAAAAAAAADGSQSGSKAAKPFRTRYWRWNGFLCRYAEGGKLDDPNAPALVMIHGFGASVDQFSGCFEELQDKYRLYALDSVGFGHSIKPALSYTQYCWADQARDFALEIVRGPFYIAGNSIGGFTAMTVAAATRSLCRGVILLNSAGRLLPPDGLTAEKARFGGLSVSRATRRGILGDYGAPSNTLLGVFSEGLFRVLQLFIPNMLKWLYPVNPDALIDGRLAADILRDSRDPGAAGIFSAGAKLPPPASANELLERYGGATLVVQGVKDPLNDAKARADGFQALAPVLPGSIEVVRLEAGHCPHEEAALEVCAAMDSFIQGVETGNGSGSGSGGSGSGGGGSGDAGKRAENSAGSLARDGAGRNAAAAF